MKVLADMTVPARLESLERLLKLASESALQSGFTGESLLAVKLVAEEAVVNVFKYSYPHGEGDVRLRCMVEGDRFAIEVTDRGIPFDATAQPPPDIASPLEKRPVGGLGIHLMRNMTDEISYKREDGRNVLRLFIRKQSTSRKQADAQ